MSGATIAIIGGGAAGLATAIFAAESPRRAGDKRSVIILDGAAKLGAKILVSGGGRCNVTHDRVTPDDYFGPTNVVRNILRRFDERAAIAWFESMGVKLKHEATGKLFPVSDKAATVLNALVNRCHALDVEIRTTCRVTSVERRDDHFMIHHAQGHFGVGTVVLATGGRSLPKTGSDGGGYALARSLGHSITPTYPALVPLVLDGSMFHAAVSGVSHEAELCTFVDGKRVDRRAGSLLWTHFGISGPVAMDASRCWTIARGEGHDVTMTANLLPGESFESVERWLIDAAASPKRTVAALIAERLPKRLVEQLLTHCGITGSCALGQLSREARRRLVHALAALPLPIVRDRGWNYAEVTAGGVPLSQVDPRTMASRVCPGLYLVGEILDCDGRIGGFNFQWAWATGHIAGRAIGDVLTIAG